MNNRRVTYSQNYEDIILDGFFKDVENGFYVDVGASHPVVSSVTKLFYEKGWSGINIEPNKKLWKLLQEDRPRDINLMVGVSNKDSTLSFREYEGYGLSTFSSNMKAEHTNKKDDLTSTYKDYEVPVTTLKNIFDKHKIKKIHFLKVDVEGLEYEALEGNDWKKYRPEVICIESNHIFKDWRLLLESNDYTLAFNDGLNDYYVAKEAKNRADKFTYADAVLLSGPVIPLYWHQKLGRAEQLQFRREAELRHERNLNAELKRELEYIKQELFLQRKTRNLLKRMLRNIDANIIGLIKKLNEPKVKAVSKGIKLPKSIENSNSIDQVIKAVRANDMENFYSYKKSAGYKKHYLYTVVNTVYFVLRGFVKLIFKAVRKLLRLIIRRGKQ